MPPSCRVEMLLPRGQAAECDLHPRRRSWLARPWSLRRHPRGHATARRVCVSCSRRTWNLRGQGLAHPFPRRIPFHDQEAQAAIRPREVSPTSSDTASNGCPSRISVTSTASSRARSIAGSPPSSSTAPTCSISRRPPREGGRVDQGRTNRQARGRSRQATRCEGTRCRAGDHTHGAHVTLTRAVRCDSTLTEDRAPVRTDPSAVPGAETEGRAVALNGTADLPFGIGTYAINLRGRRPRSKRHGAARCSLTP
jgi:hypothetical protein